MRETEIEERLKDLEEQVGQEGGEDEEFKQKLQTLKMQVGKLRSRLQDLEEKLDERDTGED